MWTVMASYTAAAAMSPSPVLLPAASSVPRRGSWRPAVAFRSSASVKCRRPLTVTCSLPPEKEGPPAAKERRPPAFDIPPTALLRPVPPQDENERWDIKEDQDRVTLYLYDLNKMPGLSATDIEVTTGEDVLEIKRKAAAATAPEAETHGVGAFHVRLLVTKDYDAAGVTADLFIKASGMLGVTVPKNPKRKSKRVVLGAPPSSHSHSSDEQTSTTKRSSGSDETTTDPPNPS